MKKLSLSIVLVAMVGVLACGEADNAEAPGDAAKTEAPKEAAAKKASDKLQGTWSVVLSAEEKRQVDVLKLALKDPAPTEEDMTKMSLTDDEKMMVALMAAAKAENPDDPKVKEMQAAAEGLASATVTITADSMTFKAGPMEEKSTYKVASQTDTSVTIAAMSPTEEGQEPKEETATITFEGDDKIVMADGGDATKTQTFTRKK